MDFYIILGVDRGVTTSDLKRAYKRLARKFHPDINPGDRMAAAQFRQIAEAYETLIDPDRRRRYDSAGHQVSADPVSYGFEGFDFSATVSGSSTTTFGDLFADVINERTQRDARRPARRDGDASGPLPHVQGHRRDAHRRNALRPVSGDRRREDDTRPHGVLASMYRL